MTLKKLLFVSTASLVLLTLSTSANAALTTSTVAAFANPSASSDNPLFTVDFTNNEITGGWTDIGLTLNLPAAGTSYNDVTFSMTDLEYTANETGGDYTTGGGEITFKNIDTTTVLTISFEQLWLHSREAGMEAKNAIYADGVTFNSPDFGTLTDNAQFGFTFSNIMPNDDGHTATASFDSAAVVPEPTTVLLLSGGFLTLIARRKKQ